MALALSAFSPAPYSGDFTPSSNFAVDEAKNQAALDQLSQQRDARQYVTGKTDQIVQAMKNKDATDKGVQALMIANPTLYKGLSDMIASGDDDAKAQAGKLADFHAGMIAHIESAPSRGESKEQAWSDAQNFLKLNGMTSPILSQGYSDNGLALLKNSLVGVKGLFDGTASVEQTPQGTVEKNRAGEVVKVQQNKSGDMYGKQLTPALDKDGNLVYLQASGAGGVSPVQGFAPPPGITTIDQGGSTIIVSNKTGKRLDSVAKGLTPAQQNEYSPEIQAGLARAKEIGQQQGRNIGTIQANAVKASQLTPIIEEAKNLIPMATDSWLGYIRDQAGRVIGQSTTGSENTAKLKVLEAKLMMAQPRMEGPQSDKDVALYRQMAASIGDPTVPQKNKLAALATIEALKNYYEQGQNQPQQPQQPKAPKSAATSLPAVNSRGWSLHVDGMGRKAYVSPDGKSYEVVK